MSKPNAAQAFHVVNKPNLNSKIIIKKDKLGENKQINCAQSFLTKFKVDCTRDTNHTKKIEKDFSGVAFSNAEKSLLYNLPPHCVRTNA